MLAALKEIGSGGGGRGGGGGGGGGRGGGSASSTITITLGEVHLNRTGLKGGVSGVRVEIDMPGAEGGKLRDVKGRLSGGRAALDATEAYDAAAGTELRRAINKDELDIFIVCHATDRSGADVSELGSATIQLDDDILRKGKDLPSGTKLPLIDAKTNVEVGTVALGVTALAALTSGGAGGADATMALEVKEVALTRPPAGKGGVQVLVDALGVRDAEVTSGKGDKTGAGVWSLGFKHEFDVGRGTKLRDAIAAALESDNKADSELQLVVQFVPRAGEPSDLGTCYISLEELLDAKADLRNATRPVLGRDREKVGTLTLGLTALAALEAIDDEVEGAASDTSVTLTVDEMTLARPPKGDVVVVVDLLGAASATSGGAALRAGIAHSLGYDARFDLAPGSAARAAVVSGPRRATRPPPESFSLRPAADRDARKTTRRRGCRSRSSSRRATTTGASGCRSGTAAAAAAAAARRGRSSSRRPPPRLRA